MLAEKLFIKIRVLVVILLISVFSLFRYDIFAIEPISDAVGLYYGSATLKGILPELEERDIYLDYNGQEQIIDISEKYKDLGTVYYKVGEGGTWSATPPSVKEIGEYKIFIYVKGDDYHFDYGSQEAPVDINVIMRTPAFLFGNSIKKESDEVINYIEDNGTTSAEVTGNEIIWLQENSGGTSAWYGLDNREGVFRRGSKFWVRWLNKEIDKELYQKYYDLMDDEHKRRAEVNKLWIFLTGVTDPDGNEYGDLGLDVLVPYYIQIGDDWEKDDINALFISENDDESIKDIQFIDTKVSNPQFENINFPETSGEYARLLLRHFSPYAIYDEEDSYENNQQLNSEINKSESNKNINTVIDDESKESEKPSIDAFDNRFKINLREKIGNNDISDNKNNFEDNRLDQKISSSLISDFSSSLISDSDSDSNPNLDSKAIQSSNTKTGDNNLYTNCLIIVFIFSIVLLYVVSKFSQVKYFCKKCFKTISNQKIRISDFSKALIHTIGVFFSILHLMISKRFYELLLKLVFYQANLTCNST